MVRTMAARRPGRRVGQVQAEPAFYPVGVRAGAGELAEAVLVRDADPFRVVQDVGGEGEERVS